MRKFADISMETFLLRKAGLLTTEQYVNLEQEASTALKQELEVLGDPDAWHEVMQNVWANDPRTWAAANKPTSLPQPHKQPA